MSTGKRLAKRSIIGTRVCAPGPDGLWYSGVIQDVKTPPKKGSQSEKNCINLTSDTRYLVRFDFKTQSQSTPSTIITRTSSGSTITTTQLQSSQPIESTDNEDTIMMDTTQTAGGNIIQHQHQQNIHQQHHPYHYQQLQQQHQQHIIHHIQARTDVMLSPAQSVRRNAMIKEFRESELIGPGFRPITGIKLHPGQRVFLTYNGRETSGDVITHDVQRDEVLVKITPIGYEEPLELKKRLEEVRLLESRRSARLADQDRDTDFARLADMAGDRRRASHSIDVPLALTQHNSRKRRPSYSQDERENFLTQFGDDDQMDACNAALVLMSLSCSPRSPSTFGQWNTILGSSPGSSSASWTSGTSSPPLSDDGAAPNSNVRIRTTSLSTSDEGIVMDYNDDAPRKRRVNNYMTRKLIKNMKKPKKSMTVNARGPIFQCTWKGCRNVEISVPRIEQHIRNTHLGPKKVRRPSSDTTDGGFSDSDHEEEFYYTEIEENEGKAPSPPSPPTLSHRDMARPPHEDPEYQRQIVGNFRQGLLALSQSNSSKNVITYNINNVGPINIPTSPLAHHNYTWNSPVSPVKHARWSPRPSTSSAPYPSPNYIHHHYNNNNIGNQHQQTQQSGLTTITQNAANINTLSQSVPPSPSNISSLTTAATLSPNVHHPSQQQYHQQQQTHRAQHLPTPQQHLQQQTNVQTTAVVTTVTAPTTTTTNHRSPQSPNRRTRGDNKKCRKVYGMDNKDQWCTQCRWKKACSRFGD